MNIVTGNATSAIDGTLTGGGDIYLINPNGVIFQDLVPAHEDQPLRQAVKPSEKRRDERIRGVMPAAVMTGKDGQFFRRQRRIGVPVVRMGISGKRQIRPRRDRHDPRRPRQAGFFQFQGEGIAQASARGFADQGNGLLRISVQDPSVSAESILEGGRERGRLFSAQEAPLCSAQAGSLSGSFLSAEDS